MGIAPFSLHGGRIIGRYSTPRKYEGIIVLLDALGMKGIWSEKNPIHVLQAWDRVYYAFESAVNNIIFPSPNISLQFKAFSDTVIITASDKNFLERDPAEFIQFMAHCIIQPFLIGLERNIYLRGVISAGEFYQSSKMVIGPAVDEAAAVYTSPNWIGVSGTPAVTSLLRHYRPSSSDALVQYDIPHKCGIEKNGWALAWPYYANHYYGIYYRNVLVSECRNHIGGKEYEKYYHSLQFYDVLIKG